MNAERRRMPDFILAGAMECGTEGLLSTLARHPELFLSTPNALDFFQDDANYQRGVSHYASFFEACPEGHIAGESSPEYLHYPLVAERIAKVLPDAKILILLRNPVDRAYEAYCRAVRGAGESLPFERAIDIETKRIASDPYALRHYSYTKRGLYAEQIRPYIDHFDRSRILVQFTEDLLATPKRVMKEVTGFLGLPCYEEFIESAGQGDCSEEDGARISVWRRLLHFGDRSTGYPHTRSSGGDPRVPRSIRKRLNALYAKSNAELARMLGRSLPPWT